MHYASSEAILDEFKAKLEGYTRRAVCGRYFVLVDSLQDWLRSPAQGDVPYADRLLHGVAYKHRQLPGIPISSNKLKAGDDCCLLVFCILQTLGRGDLIHSFSRKEKVDRLLPLSTDDLQDVYKNGEKNDQNFVSQFLELQHRFRPARFDLHDRTEWKEHKVIPIYRKNLIKKGVTATVWQVDVPEEFVGKRLRDVASGSRFNANTDEAPDWVCTIVIDFLPSQVPLIPKLIFIYLQPFAYACRSALSICPQNFSRQTLRALQE